MTTPRPAVLVVPRRELESRPLLFGALERALRLRFIADSSPDPVATVVLGDADVPIPNGIPTLRLAHREPPIGAKTAVRLANSVCLDPALRGRVLSDGFAGLVDALPSSAVNEVLASDETRVLWAYDRSNAEELAAVVPNELAVGEALRDRLRPGAILPLLPLTSFLLRVAEAAGLQRAPLRAAFLIDDPNLHRTRYGYLDFGDLAARASAEGWHMAFATIPLDAWYVDRRAIRFFMPPEAWLSLLFHGNNHLKHELASLGDDDQALQEMGQAVRRIRRLEDRTGLRVSRVMAPPHGRYSPTAARALARVGFEALCISNAYPWLEPGAPRQPLAGWLPGEFVEGLPIIPRHHILGDTDEIVLRAFLRQPLIVYGHHTDAADGLDVFSDAARRVYSLGDVSWMDLQAIVRSNAETFVVGDYTVIRPYSGNATIDLSRPSRVFVEMDAGHDLDVAVTAGGTTHLGPGPHAIEASGPLTVSARRRDCVDTREIASPRPTVWPVPRRVLTEARDRLVPLTRR